MDTIALRAMAESISLQKFLRQEIDRRELSNRKFADLVGVDSKTINKYVDDRFAETLTPSIDVLDKIATVLNINVFVLLTIAYPQLEPRLVDLKRVGGDTLLRSQRIENLPPDVRNGIDIIIENAKLPKDDQDV